MTVALEMFLDPAADAAVRQLWARLEQAGIPSLASTTHRGHHPHVTLAVGERIATGDGLLGAVRDLPGTALTLPLLGTFPGAQSVLFLGVTVHAELLRAHAAVHAAIESESDGLWELYRPGNWVPHCTLAMSVDADGLSRAVAQLHPYSAVTGRIGSVNLVGVETGEATRLA